MELIRKVFSATATFVGGFDRDRSWWNFPHHQPVLFAAKCNCNYADQRVGLVARTNQFPHAGK